MNATPGAYTNCSQPWHADGVLAPLQAGEPENGFELS